MMTEWCNFQFKKKLSCKHLKKVEEEAAKAAEDHEFGIFTRHVIGHVQRNKNIYRISDFVAFC